MILALLIPVAGLCCALALLFPRWSRPLAILSAVLFGVAVVLVLVGAE